jgi:hypothetical protein
MQKGRSTKRSIRKSKQGGPMRRQQEVTLNKHKMY